MKKGFVFALLFSFVFMSSFVSAQLNDCRIHERDAIYNTSYGALYDALNTSY